MGAIHGRGYYDRIGLGEACFSGARGRCGGSDGSAQAASACAGSGVLQSTAALSGWPGGVRDGALLGAGVARAWPRGATDAGAIREGVHQAQQGGNQYLRRLLINGASANLLRSKATNADPWVIGLRQRRPSLVVAVALANKT